MGVIVKKLGKPKDDTEVMYQFSVSKTMLKSFGQSELCNNILDMLDDLIDGTRIDLELCAIEEDMRYKGILEGLHYIRAIFDNFKNIQTDEED